MSIDELRARIDALDDELLQLVSRRARLSGEVALAKKAQGLPARDPAREAEMLARAQANAPSPLTPHSAATALGAIIDSTRALAALQAATPAPDCRVAIAGLGLIGGSLAMALKRSNPAHRIAGIDLGARLDKPRALGLFDSLHEPGQGRQAVADAEVVFLCAPPSANLELLSRVRADVGPGTIVTDVSGIKSDICAAATALFGAADGPWFLGGHPMAGRAKGGLEGADAALFAQRPWVLTPRPRHPLPPLKRLQGLIESTGAQLHLLTPEDHDRTVVAVSHLPQLLSIALMLCAGGRDRGIAGPGLREMTRLAQSPPGLWSELLHSRKDLVTQELQRLRSYLSDLEMAVAFAEPMAPWFDKAAALRTALDHPAPTA